MGLRFREVEQKKEETSESRPLDEILHGDTFEFLGPGGFVRVGGKKKGTKSVEPPGLKLDSGNKPPSGEKRTGRPQDDDADRVVAILKKIGEGLRKLVELKAVPTEILPAILDAWPDTNEKLQLAIKTLQDKKKRAKFKPVLASAGFVGVQLGAKEVSLNYHMRQLKKGVLTYNDSHSKSGWFAKFIKPCLSVMNSILGSLKSIPGLEIVKEFKDHLEAGIEAVAAGQEE